MLFQDIPDTFHIKKKLLTLEKYHRLPHAQLFFGTFNSPCVSLSMALATYLHCQAKKEEDACGVCKSCQKIDRGIHPDMYYILPINSRVLYTAHHYTTTWMRLLKKNFSPSLESWATEIGAQKQLMIPKEITQKMLSNIKNLPIESDYKIFLIWCPEYFHVSMANALLKTLEEPPVHVLFFLVTHNIDQVLPTIISRAQHFHVPSFSKKNIHQILSQSYQGHPKLDQWLFMSHHDFNMTQKWLVRANAFQETFTFFHIWLRSCFKKDSAQLIKKMEEFATWTQTEQCSFFFFVLYLMKHMLHHCFNPLPASKMPADVYLFIQNFVKIVDDTQLIQMIQLLQQKYHQLQRNAQAKMLFLSLSLAIHRVLKPL